MGDRSGSARLRVLFEPALQAYEGMTGITLAEHPLAAQLQSCQSIRSITALLQDQVPVVSEYRGMERIVKSIEGTIAALATLSATASFSDVICMAFPPVKVICAGLAILLAAAKGIRAGYSALIDLLESIDHFLRHLDIYSRIRPTPVLDEIVIKIMADLLSTLALLTKELKQRRSMQSVKKLFSKNIEAVLVRLDQLTPNEARTSAAEVLRVIHSLVRNMNVVVKAGKPSTSGLREALEILHKIENDKNRPKRDALRRDLQNWLSPPDPWENHYIARESHQEGTATWFVESETFSEWKTPGPSSLLWIHGKPGSGKSVLCSTIIEEIELMRIRGLASLAFHYYDFREGEKKDRRGLLSSVLVQLCHQSDSYCDILSTFYSQHANGSQPPSDDALFRCLKAMLQRTGQGPIFLIVDALDECPNIHTLSAAREKVLTLLEDLMDLNLPNLHLCITSRPEVDIKVILQPLAFRSVSIHDESGQIRDIENYIKSIVNSNRKMRRWTPEHRQLVIDVLTNQADGMWQWVYCQLDYLSECLPGRIRHALDELPKTLDETYERTLREIKGTNWEFSQRLFLCVAVAVRPLRAEELAEILAFDFKSGPIPKFREDWRMEDPLEAVLSTCSTLLALVDVDDSPVIQFSHFSVKEFLTSARLAEKQNTISCRYHVSMTLAHTLVAQACLGTLLHLDENITRDDLEKFPLAEYAAMHWFAHARFEGVSENVEEAMKQLFGANSPHLAVWVWICDPCNPRMLFKLFRRVRRPSKPRGSPLHYAAMCGLPSVVNFLVMECPQDVHSHAFQDKSTPLHLASRRGNMEVARLLMKYGADATAKDNKGSSPLHLAMREEYMDLLRFFVQCGADTTITDERSTLFHLAVQKKDTDLVHLLIEHGADVRARSNEGLTMLHLAVQEGSLEISRLLVERGADVKAKDFEGSSPLHFAVHNGSVDLARLLVDKGAAATSRDNKQTTPLHLAAGFKNEDLARLLVDCGADVTAKNNKGLTPLHMAVREGSVGLARLLLENGADVTTGDENGSTALHLAVQQGSADITRFLIEHGADTTAQNGRRQTPLHLAVHRNSVDLMQILVDHGADAEVQARRCRTALHLAVKMKSMNHTRFLIEHGADVTARGNDGLTPLHWAVLNGSLDLTRLLVERGADLTAGDNNGSAALHLAVEQGNTDITRFLIEHCADTAALDVRGQTPLHLAVHRESVDLIRILVKYGADVKVRDRRGQTPLHLAVQMKNMNHVRFLIEHGADVEVKDRRGRTPLYVAVKMESMKHARFLVEHGAEVRTGDNNEWTPLHLAVRNGSVDLARFLIEHGADTAALDCDGQTPLHSAVQGKSMDLVCLLVEHGAAVTVQNIHGWTPLHLAVQRENMDFARLLVEHGADVTAETDDAQTPLHEAAYIGSMDLLVERGANVAAKSESGLTPLHIAVRRRDMDLALLLVEHGADVTARGSQGTTSLHLAVRQENMYFAHFLIEHGADARAKADNGTTPLHLAVEKGSVDIARLLIKHGADVLAQRNDGSTPLELALQGENEDLTRLILDHTT